MYFIYRYKQSPLIYPNSLQKFASVFLIPSTQRVGSFCENSFQMCNNWLDNKNK